MSYGVACCIIASPVFIAGGLIYAAFEGCRAAIKKITILANKEQGARFDKIVKTTIEINRLGDKDCYLTNNIKLNTDSLNSKKIQLEQIRQIANTNIVLKNDSVDLQEGTKTLFQDIEIEYKNKAKANQTRLEKEINELQTSIFNSSKELKIVKHNFKLEYNVYNTNKKLYDEGKPISKISQAIICTNPFGHVKNCKIFSQ